MQQHDQMPTQTSHFEDLKNAAYWLRLIANAWAMSVIVFLRKDFGHRFLDLRAFFALCLIFVYPIFWSGEDPRPVLVFLLLFILMCARARFEMRRNRRRGRIEHSRYSGRPRLMKNFPKLDEQQVKRTAEPAYVLFCGICLLPFTQPLAMFLIIAAACLRGTAEMARLYEREKAQATIDAMIDAQHHAERVRAMSEGRW